MKLNLITIPLFCLITSNAQAIPPKDIRSLFPRIVNQQTPSRETVAATQNNTTDCVSNQLNDIEQWHSDAVSRVTAQKQQLSLKIGEYAELRDKLKATHTKTVIELNTHATQELSRAYQNNAPTSEIAILEMKIAKNLETISKKFETETRTLTKKIVRMTELMLSLEKHTKLELLTAKQHAISITLPQPTTTQI